MDKHTVIYSYSGILLSHKKEQTLIHTNTDKCQERHAEQKKPDARVHSIR